LIKKGENTMNSRINLEKMKEVYGSEILEIILDNIDIVEKNIEYLDMLKFDDTVGIFERCPIVFTCFPNDFKNKIDKLIQEIGENYVEIIEDDIGLIESLI
jgi:hypothetical protein